MKKSTLNLPNSITLIRALFIIPLTYFLINRQTIYIAGLLTIFLLFDILDGFLARKLKQETNFGKVFDWTIDVLFSGIIFIGLLIIDKIPTLVLILILANFIPFAITIFILIKRKKFKTHDIICAFIGFGLLYLLILEANIILIYIFIAALYLILIKYIRLIFIH